MINRKERVSDVADDYSCEYLNALEKLKQRKIIGRKAKKKQQQQQNKDRILI
jgi:hypothetical protein